MKKIIFLFICMVKFLSAEVREIHQLSELENATGQLKSSDWLLFDIDYTLTEPSQPALQMRAIKANQLGFKEELARLQKSKNCLYQFLWLRIPKAN